MCVGVYAYMYITENINSTAYKSDYSIYFFLLVKVILNKEFSSETEIDEFSFFKKEIFFMIILKDTYYFT